MKKRMGRFSALVCLVFLWASLSGFISESQSTVSCLYEWGQWAGRVCGTYQGTLSNQVPSGNGTIRFDQGGSYSGSFLFGHPWGTGTYTFANGQSLRGEFTWSNGTGYVMEKSTTGDTPHYNGTDMVYVGMLENGQPCGFGTLDFQDGGTFYGEFLNGTVQGKGVYVYREPDGATEVTGSNWSMVNRVPSSLGGRWYSGLVSGGTWQGYGMLCYNYSYYIGEVVDNYCHGHGTYWQWSQIGDPSGTLTRKDYGHYNTGGLVYECSHDSKPIPWSPAPAICEGCGGNGYVPCPACGGSGWK